MASCDYCNTTILFGGVRDGELRFCNETCHQNACVVSVAGALPEADLSLLVEQVHSGPCPICEGPGPVDIHRVHKVWSLLLMCSCRSDPCLCCRACGARRQTAAILYSLALGWWSLPWGLIMTPIQIGRNLLGIVQGPNPLQPSDALDEAIRLDIAAGILNSQAEAQPLD